MKPISYFFIFLAINFGGLAFGSWLMNNGPTSDWYSNLNKAPWTPPGWVFGVAWTTIMICFSIYLAKLFTSKKRHKTPYNRICNSIHFKCELEFFVF